MSVETTLEVVGMTCGHCVSAVRDELMALDSVRDVHVELDSGRARVTSDAALDPAAVAAAIDEAGYELAS